MDSRCLTKGLDMSTIDPRDEHVFPKLTPQEIDRLRRFGEVRRYAPGDGAAFGDGRRRAWHVCADQGLGPRHSDGTRWDTPRRSWSRDRG